MLRIGLLGAGNFALKHLWAAEALAESVRVAGVARRREEPWEEARLRGIPQMAPDALLDAPDIDAVVISVPNGLHASYAEAALRAGKHVFCEKPLATTLEDADRLIATAERCGRVLVAGHLTRHSIPYAVAAQRLQSGELGPVVAFYSSRLQARSAAGWRLDPELGGGAGFDLLIHDFDLLGWYLGRPRSVMARALGEPGQAPRHVLALFDYGQGISPVVEGGFVLPEGSEFRASLRIVCEKGLIESDLALPTGVVLRVTREGHSPEYIPACRYSSVHKGLIGEYEEFIETIRSNTPGRLRLEDASQAVEFAVLTAEAARTGQPVPFP